MCKPLDELLIVPHQAQKGSDFYVSLGWSKFGQSLQVLLAGSHTLFGDVMSQIVNLIPEEFTLSGFLLQVVFLEVIEHNTQVLQVLILHLQEDYHIIQIE